MRQAAILSLLLIASLLLAAEDGDWRSERDVHKRAELGLEVAEAQLDEARRIYREVGPYKAQEQLEKSLDTALEVYQMIVDSGEDMRKRAGRYKKVEIAFRGLIRKLEDHEQQVEVLDKGPVERARKTVSRMQDNLLKTMFSGGTLPPVEKVKP